MSSIVVACKISSVIASLAVHAGQIHRPGITNPKPDHKIMKTIVAVTAFALLVSNVVAGTYTMTPEYMNLDVSDDHTITGHDLRVGLTTTEGYGRAAVFVFAMPKIPFGETITGASLTFNVADVQGAPTFNGDLYSLGTSATGDPIYQDYYSGVYNGNTSADAYNSNPNGPALQEGFLTPSTSVGPVSANATGSAAIASDISYQMATGATQGSYYMLSLNPNITAPWNANEGWDIRAEQDPAGPPSLSVTTTSGVQMGRVLLEYWTGIAGTTVTSLPPGSPNPTIPSSREYPTIMEIPQGMAGNSADRLRGYFHVPATGPYIFAIASDNNSVLYFSTDGIPTDAKPVASVTGQSGYRTWTLSTQQYAVNLTTGQVCYIESQHKNGSDGTSNMSIGMQGPWTNAITVMPTTDVVPYDAGVPYSANAFASLVQPFTHPRLMMSPAAVLRLAAEIKSGNANQVFSWNKIVTVCTNQTTGIATQDDMSMGDNPLKSPLINYKNPGVAQTATPPAAGPLLNSARDLQNRIYVLSLFYLVESQLSPSDKNIGLALQQIYAECQAAAKWGTFNGQNGVWDVNAGSGGLDIAEMTHAFAIAYDWCYSGWDQTQINFFVNTISVNGLAQIDGGDGTNGPFGMQANQLGRWPYANPTIEGNWGVVCNGGAILGALAILGDETTGSGGTLGTSGDTPQAETVLNTLMPALPTLNSMAQFAPDGGWTEGPGYWDFAVKYVAVLDASLETSAATCFNMDKLSGMDSTDSFLMYDTGPTGLTYNFADSLESSYYVPAQQYLGLKYNEPLYSYPENIATDLKGHYPTDMLWNDTRIQAPDVTAPLSTYYSNMGLISLRSAWGDPNALFAGITAGYNANAPAFPPSTGPVIEHEMDQIGSFVFDALDIRWATILGSDSYTLPGYFDPKPWDATNRWQYYRCRAEGNNTLVINPSLDGGQFSYGTSTITSFVSNANVQQAIIDMTPVYATTDGNPLNPHQSATPVTSANRGFQILPGNAGFGDIMQVQDEVVTSGAQTLWWFMNTSIVSTNIVITACNPNTSPPTPSTALLTDSTGTKHLLMTLQSPVGTSFQATPMPATPFANGTSPNPSGQNANTGLVKLGIKLTTASTGTTTVNVVMAPYTTAQGINTTLPPVVPLSSW